MKARVLPPSCLNSQHILHPGLVHVYVYTVCHNNKLKCLKGTSENKSAASPCLSVFKKTRFVTSELSKTVFLFAIVLILVPRIFVLCLAISAVRY